MPDTRRNTRRGRSRLGPVVAQFFVVIAAAVWGLLHSAYSLSLSPLPPWLPWIILLALGAGAFTWSLIGMPGEQNVEVNSEEEQRMQAPQQGPDNRGYFDDLTGVPARPWFDYAIRNELARARRYKHPLSVIMMDIDGFKKINEQHGSANGDYVLMSIADILRTSVRVSDQIARVAADSFVIVVPETDIEGAKIVGQKIRRSVELFPFDEDIECTVSVGITAAAESDTPEKFMARIEKAVMAAKERGGNVCIIAKT